MTEVEQLLKSGKHVGGFYPLTCEANADFKAKSLYSFSVGDVVIDVYRSQLYKIESIAKWAILRHVASGKLSTRSLCDNHFELVTEPMQLKTF